MELLELLSTRHGRRAAVLHNNNNMSTTNMELESWLFVGLRYAPAVHVIRRPAADGSPGTKSEGEGGGAGRDQAGSSL